MTRDQELFVHAVAPIGFLIAAPFLWYLAGAVVIDALIAAKPEKKP